MRGSEEVRNGSIRDDVRWMPRPGSVLGTDEDRPTSRCGTRGDIHPCVADEPAPASVGADLLGRLLDQAGSGLAAGAFDRERLDRAFGEVRAGVEPGQPSAECSDL